MAIVKFTGHLRRFFPALKEMNVTGTTVAEIIKELDRHYPGLSGYLVDDQGSLRQHVNVFIGNQLIRDRQRLQDQVKAEDQLFIFQALSGG